MKLIFSRVELKHLKLTLAIIWVFKLMLISKTLFYTFENSPIFLKAFLDCDLNSWLKNEYKIGFFFMVSTISSTNQIENCFIIERLEFKQQQAVLLKPWQTRIQICQWYGNIGNNLTVSGCHWWPNNFNQMPSMKRQPTYYKTEYKIRLWPIYRRHIVT